MKLMIFISSPQCLQINGSTFGGEIKRSLLYTIPKDITLDVTDIFS